MTMQFADFARQAAADGVVTAEEVLALRQAGWANGKMTPDEADAVFALNDAISDRTAEWCDFFVEALCEYVINSAEPKGYVSEDSARWLMARVDHDGALQSMTELELLVRVLELSFNAPEALKRYVLGQVEQAVLTGTGPTRRDGDLAATCINAAEAAILRRVLLARAGDGPAAISQYEAEFLFKLKDAALDAPNAPEWKRLFVQGIAQFLTGAAPHTSQLTRERKAELDAFFADQRSSVLGFIGRMVKSAPTAVRALYGGKETTPEALALRQAVIEELLGKQRGWYGELAAGEEVTESEQAWLNGRVRADGTVDEYEQALVDFLAELADREV